MNPSRTACAVASLLVSLLCLVNSSQAQSPTVTTLSLGSSTVTTGSAVKINATVTVAGVPVHPGSVSFCDATAPHCEDAALLGQAQLTASGTASVSLRLGIGTHSIKAVFVGAPHGTPATAPSSSVAKTLVVQPDGKLPSVTILNSTGSPGAYKLTGTVASFGTPPINGSLTFTDQTDGSTNLGTVSLNGAAASLLFASAPSAPAGVLPVQSAIADFNGDGILDMAVANNDGDSVTILLGKGDGSFTVKKTIPLQGNVDAIATADFNSDGNADLIVSTSYETDQVILLGKGDGTFVEITTAQPAGTANRYVIGDFNGDGITDFASNDYDSVSIWLGKGDGTFDLATTIPVAEYTSNFVAADLNGDGILDLAVTIDPYYTSDTLNIFLGNGDGTFRQIASPSAGLSAEAIMTADFNRDGIPDLAVGTQLNSSGIVDILLGNGDGTFTEKSILTPENGLLQIGSTDFNGDGIPDLLLDLETEDEDTYLRVLLGKGDGTFSASTSVDVGPFAGYFSLADLNGDAIPDIISPDDYNSTVGIYLGEHAKSTTINAAISAADLQNVIVSYAGDSSHSPSQSAGIPTGNLVATPSVYPGSGAYAASTKISITDATPGASIYYAINPSPPLGGITNFVPYTGPFELPAPASPSASVYLTVIASAPGYLQSQYVQQVYKYAPATVTTLHLNTGPSVPAGSHITLSAHVTINGVAFHDGVVNFCDADAPHCEDSALLGSAPLQPGGWAVVQLLLGTGVHHIRADYQGVSGTIIYPIAYQPPFSAPSSSSVETVTVTGKSITTTQSTLATQANGSYTLSSSVDSFGPSPISGSLTFLDSINGAKAVSIGTAVLSPTDTAFTLVGPLSSATGKDPVSQASADLNHDGIPDIVTANAGDNTVSILYGKGDGSFTTGPVLSVPTTPTSVTIGHLNDGSDPNIIVTSASANLIYLYFSNGTPTFYSDLYLVAPSATLVGDFNHDGILDVASAGTGNNLVKVFDGESYDQYSAPLPAAPVNLVAADFNGDSLLDLATSNADGSVSILLGARPDSAEFSLGFTAAPLLFPGSSGALAVGDFNHDGIPDLAVPATGGVDVYLGKGDGTFTLKTTLPASNVQSLNAADFNGDTFTDIAITEKNGAQSRVLIYSNAGDATFPIYSTPVTTPYGTSTVVADFNGDGLADISGTSPAANSIGVFLGSLFTPATVTGVKLTTPGTHVIHAVYSGSSTLKPASGPPLTITVPGH